MRTFLKYDGPRVWSAIFLEGCDPITLGCLKITNNLTVHARARIVTAAALTVVCANSHRPRLLIFAAAALSLATCAHPRRDRWAVEAIALRRNTFYVSMPRAFVRITRTIAFVHLITSKKYLTVVHSVPSSKRFHHRRARTRRRRTRRRRRSALSAHVLTRGRHRARAAYA